MIPNEQENQENSGADQNEWWESEFWAEKLESTNGELRSMLSEQVVIL